MKKHNKQKILRAETLFYSDVVAYLKQVFPPQDFIYRDDFVGDLIIYRPNEVMFVIEIKSEKECDNVSSTKAKAFEELRVRINSLKIFDKNSKGKYKGWLAFIAQPWDYYVSNKLPNCIESNSFDEIEIVLAFPYDKLGDCMHAINEVSENYKFNKPRMRRLYKIESNIIILFFEFMSVNSFFENIKNINENGEDASIPIP